MPEMQKPLRVVMVAPLADYSDNKYKNGINLKLCKTQASINPSLAGLKHLNKLENVIARNEWQDRSYAEGLMLDCDGYVIEGTMSNVFAVKNNSLYTPVLKRAGVNGVVRQRIIELAKNNDIIVQQINIKLDNFYAMDEIFVTNSLLGLCPVKQVEDRRFKPGSVTRQLMTLLQQDIRGCEL